MVAPVSDEDLILSLDPLSVPLVFGEPSRTPCCSERVRRSVPVFQVLLDFQHVYRGLVFSDKHGDGTPRVSACP